MKKFFACLTLLTAFAAAPAFAGVEIGKPAPDYTFKDISGAEHSISDMKGKIVVLEWTNPHCPFVHKFYDQGDMPRIQAEAKKISDDVYWIAINSSAKDKEGFIATDEDAQKDVTARQYAGDIYVRDVKGTFGKLYGAKTTPHMFVIDEDGNVAYAGAIDSIKSPDQPDIAKADNYVLKAIEALEDGKKPEVSSTEAYGCGVKYAEPMTDKAAEAAPAATAPVPTTVEPVVKEEKVTIEQKKTEETKVEPSKKEEVKTPAKE